jgi:hypothetical protein
MKKYLIFVLLFAMLGCTDNKEHRKRMNELNEMLEAIKADNIRLLKMIHDDSISLQELKHIFKH